MLKCHHHFLGKTDIITLIRDFLAVEPGGHGEFVVVYSESVVAVQVTVEAEQESAGERPWLALVVAEIFDLYADLSITSRCTVSSIVSPISAKPAIMA